MHMFCNHVSNFKNLAMFLFLSRCFLRAPLLKWYLLWSVPFGRAQSRLTGWRRCCYSRFPRHSFAGHPDPSFPRGCNHTHPLQCAWSSWFHTCEETVHIFNPFLHVIPLPPSFHPYYVYLPGESPFWSKWIVSPDTPVKLVFIRNSNNLRPSMGRMASHKPSHQKKELLSRLTGFTSKHTNKCHYSTLYPGHRASCMACRP